MTKTLLAMTFCAAAWGQAPAVLLIDVENSVNYIGDVSDMTKLASTSGAVAGTSRSFENHMVIADIVAVNGQPVKGTFVNRGQLVTLSPTAGPGQAMANISRTGANQFTFEIQKLDGSPVGSIMAVGLAGGPAPPGGPLLSNQGNNAISGGTGAFVGVRGQAGQVAPAVAANRAASMAEDPLNRQTNGAAGKLRFVLQLLPESRPQVAAVTHSKDYTMLSATSPAVGGEILSVFATGLGATVPAVDLGQPFPAAPPAVVSAPVDVLVNGKSAEVLGAVGFPGSVDGYQVNFRMPPDLPKGTATVQLRAAWIPGIAVSIPVQ
jgi:uncharacterized protein (TIGR03437 family)